MSKKAQTQWDRVPKKNRWKVIRYGILGAFIGYLGLLFRTPLDITDEADQADKKE